MDELPKELADIERNYIQWGVIIDNTENDDSILLRSAMEEKDIVTKIFEMIPQYAVLFTSVDAKNCIPGCTDNKTYTVFHKHDDSIVATLHRSTEKREGKNVTQWTIYMRINYVTSHLVSLLNDKYPKSSCQIHSEDMLIDFGFLHLEGQPFVEIDPSQKSITISASYIVDNILTYVRSLDCFILTQAPTKEVHQIEGKNVSIATLRYIIYKESVAPCPEDVNSEKFPPNELRIFPILDVSVISKAEVNASFDMIRPLGDIVKVCKSDHIANYYPEKLKVYIDKLADSIKLLVDNLH